MNGAEHQLLETDGDTAAPKAHRSERLRIDPPALVPQLVRPPRRYAEMIVGIAVMLIAGLAHLTGAAPLISLFLAALGAIGLAIALHTAAADEHLVTTLARKEADSRGELEDLADRMWELRESEERFHGLVDALGDLIVHRDRNGRIVYVNRIFAELLDRESDTLIGRTLSQLGIDIGLVPDAAFSGGECLSSTDVAIHTRNGMRWYSWIEHSVRDEKAGSVSHRAIARDITARKRAETALINARERAEQASRAKSSFLATVSHEIRTPMNGIMGMATLLADTNLTAEQRTYVGAVSTSASALVALIEDLLDYSKIEAGRLELEQQQISVHDMAENVVELLAARAFAKNIGLGCYIAPDVPSTITADPGRLRQVLMNLLGNAVKFTDAGGVAVSLTRGEKNGAPALRIAVADSGPGLEKEDITRIFKDFEQVDGSSTRRHGGAGLGLAITKRIVDAMQGSITVASTPGEGSEFAVLLPLESAPERAVVEPILAHVNAVILSPHVEEAETIAMTIRVYGGRAAIAANAEDAARLAEEAGRPFDTMLIDAALESDDGSLIARLHQSGVSAGRALTLITPSERGRLAAFRASGYGAFLARPVRGKTLLRQLLSEHGEIALPVVGADKAGSVPEAPPVQDKAGLRVLVAEDNEINAMLARAALTKGGHRVDLVSNGRAAVEAVSDAGHRYDVVLMDLHMPVMDGLDAINAIRRHEEETGLAPVPILVLSADGQEKTRHGVLAHGANGFVTKPLDPDKLLSALEMHAAG
ncbi:PAS domain-containing hybrid sensor histidine kinase/response regulator [Nitratireductor pacificus]|uniref:Sensory/regulatory protein RpfC n=1 Tax=Nitratireductor pacificus pht-3B TaxID=391937 RepID=K2N7I6_9HYPH|nr:PAS domain-containing hybrid sensor histidine kinase/response regulator [Nitratireductor pacificus]EKF20073.1 two-component sensor/response regulator hybrid [Nitratireductor pacificus pht-3B]